MVDNQAAALAVVRKLTGGRWVWPPVRVHERYPTSRGRLVLRGRPVRRVVSVTSHATGEDLEYELQKNGWMELKRPVRCGRDPRVDVVYEYGSRPSVLVLKAVEALAAEFALADRDDAGCRLPERVTSVTRQGTSWTLIDPQDFFDKGRVGIYEVDLAIAALTGKAKARSRVFSSEFPPPERISTTRLPDPGTNAVILIGRGETLEVKVEYRDSTGDLVNMTGGSAQLLIKQLGTGDTVYTEDSEQVGASGIIEVDVPSSVTETWSPGDYGFVIAYTDPSGNVEWVHQGTLTIEPGGV